MDILEEGRWSRARPQGQAGQFSSIYFNNIDLIEKYNNIPILKYTTRPRMKNMIEKKIISPRLIGLKENYTTKTAKVVTVLKAKGDCQSVFPTSPRI